MIREFHGNQVRIMGRTVMDGDMLWMVSSLSEVAFTVSGAKELVFLLRADDSVTDPARQGITPRYAVYLDGKKVRDACMKEEQETVTVFREETPRSAVVRLKKLSECTQSLFALEEIRTDGIMMPLPDMAGKIEIIGDSITCGYGVETDNPEDQFTTKTENAEKSYAGILAEQLGLDRMLTSFSGHGIVSGYTDNPEVPNLSELVPPYYEKTGRNGFVLPSGRTVTDIDWDFSAWQPDDIIINLGTNDLSWCQEFPERKEKYRKMYVQFLKTVRKNNPHARMLCILGAMGEGLNEHMQAAVRDYIAETGDRHIRAVSLKEQNGLKNGYGANYHPSAITQQELAETVIRELRNH